MLHPSPKIYFIFHHDHHFYKTDQYILNKDGYFLTFDRYYETFALRKTYLGTECDIHALKDIRSSAENLASFHNHCLAISFHLKS